MSYDINTIMFIKKIIIKKKKLTKLNGNTETTSVGLLIPKQEVLLDLDKHYRFEIYIHEVEDNDNSV